MEAAAQGWVAPPLAPGVAAALSAISKERFQAVSRASWAKVALSPSWPTCREGFPGTQFVATGVLGPHSNAHGPNESLHIPMAKAVTHAVAELLKEV